MREIASAKVPNGSSDGNHGSDREWNCDRQCTAVVRSGYLPEAHSPTPPFEMRLVRRTAASASAALVVATLLLASAVAAPLPAQGAATGEKPSLVVFLTVDQLRPDYLTRWHDQLTGGLRRLIDDGAFAPQGVHDHAITETAP